MSGSSLVPLARIKIEGFRAVREMALPLDPQVTVLFGSNGAGKTTVLDALAIGLGAMVGRAPNVKGRGFAQAGDLHVDYGRRVEVTRAHVELESHAGVVWGVTRWRSQVDRQREGAPTGPQRLYQALDPLLKAVMDAPGEPCAPLPLVALYGNERAVVDVPLRQRDFRKEFSRFEALEGALSASTRFKAVFEWFLVAEDEERRQQQRRRDFSYRLPELEWVRRALEQAELHISRPRIETRPLRMLVDFHHPGGEVEVLDIKSLSDGYRTHFALVVDVARRMVQLNPALEVGEPWRGTNSPAVILIDEVDLHLDPAWQARVVKGLRQAFPNAQFVLTTHSEQVVGSVEAHQVRQLVWSAGEVIAAPVAFAQGATGERILVELMGAWERVPGPVTQTLTDYLALVSDGLGDGEDARALREALEAALPHDPQLHQADLEMQRRALLSQLGFGKT
jgi:predicted ATP-binding protein involved in virulence